MGGRTGSMKWCCQSGCIIACPVQGHVLPFILPAPSFELLHSHRQTAVVTSPWPALSLPGSCTKGPATSFYSCCFQGTPVLCQTKLQRRAQHVLPAGLLAVPPA